MAGQPATRPSDKTKVLPVASQDINCPEVTIADGGAALRVGGPDNASVRYQFNIGDTARQCDPAGPWQAAHQDWRRGPGGDGAGRLSRNLQRAAEDHGDPPQRQEVVFSQTYRAEAATDGVTAGTFRVVTDPITLPMPTLQLADLYSITVGFEGGTGGPSPTGRRTRKRRAGA